MRNSYARQFAHGAMPALSLSCWLRVATRGENKTDADFVVTGLSQVRQGLVGRAKRDRHRRPRAFHSKSVLNDGSFRERKTKGSSVAPGLVQGIMRPTTTDPHNANRRGRIEWMGRHERCPYPGIGNGWRESVGNMAWRFALYGSTVGDAGRCYRQQPQRLLYDWTAGDKSAEGGVSMEDLLARLDLKVRRIHAARPLPPATLDSLRAWLRVETTYTSNAIEGNVLTRQETTVVLEGLTIGGKPLRDHLEALDHAEAFDYMYDLAQQHAPFTETDLRMLHQLMLRRSQPDHAGRYRDVQVWILGAVHVPPPPVLVPVLMADLFRDLVVWATDHPVRQAARFHGRLAAVHPFVDGNGRTARLAANLLLMRTGYPVTMISPVDRASYFAALAAFDEGHEDPLVEIFAAACERTADVILQGLVPVASEADAESDR
ncbi:MAG: hypothetical protein C7B45_13585 [Sulfobacillus acidophilus]|uniref:Fido domain-containing protein n=1 Tax=Sulfobacillus acidophilus TaxID=53633 RepID=A0A2T2WEQ3_9FIRM|nr:MAG: hypothetical protein C7B45_13585 [Sulfobacillus acidophilus]